MRMFKGMREQGFEVHMATTTGVQEKCIDIALAVEMIHYATIPHTYDVGGKNWGTLPLHPLGDEF